MNSCICPEKGQLHQYLLGTLAPPESQGIDEHLEECPGCLATVDELDTTVNGVFACLRQPAPPQVLPSDPAFERLVHKVKILGCQGAPMNDQADCGEGQILGNYELIERIGAGGMGHVFKARHQRMKRLVALKVLTPEMLRSPAARARFQREVEAIARLSSPYIVAAYDAGQCRDRDFLVMEYVAGCNLAELVKKHGPLPLDRALDYVLQAARGLADAHAAGIIHRDIKPANLLVSGEAVKVLDLGLARVFAEDKPAGLSTAHVVMGTAAFMAPEQGLNTHQADERADIYSLGCCLFYLLTGKPLFEARTDMEILLAHREQPIPSLRNCRPDCPAAVEALFRTMVAKRRQERPASMRAVIAELERLQSPRAGHRPRRWPLLACGFGLAATLLLALLLPHLGDDSFDSRDDLGTPNPSKAARQKRIVASVVKRNEPGNTTHSKSPTASGKVRQAPVIEMASLPAGEFWMGSRNDDKDAAANEKPRRKIKITVPFLLAKTKITQAQYQEVMGKNPSAFRAGGRFKLKVGDKDTSQHPVESLSWLDAVHFCNRLSNRHGLDPYYKIDDKTVTVRGGTGYRLPTEAEWEYACRAGTDTPWYFGETPAAIDQCAWYAGNSGDITHPVGKKKANAFGLFDMHGNVPEWCWDRYDPEYYKRGPVSDPPGPGVGKTRVYRGGAWNDDAIQTRSAARNSLATGYGVLTIVGIRVARNANP